MIGNARIVDVHLCAQHVDGALQVLDQLDLLRPILGAEPDGLSSAASERGIDRDHDGAVLREQPTDGRRTELLLTRAGEAVIRSVEPIAQAYRREALDGIDAEQVARLRELLERIVDNCDARRSMTTS
jgi:hypothetical protein